MDTGLGGKVAMVSGASKGIGRAIAEKLAVEGVRLSLCARGADQLRAVARDLEDKHGAACLAYPADLSRAEDIQGWVRATVEQLGGIDILINNAGAAQGGAFLAPLGEHGVPALGADSARVDARDEDAVGGALVGQRLGEVEEGGIRGPADHVVLDRLDAAMPITLTTRPPPRRTRCRKTSRATRM
jgi:hypothetical protein